MQALNKKSLAAIFEGLTVTERNYDRTFALRSMPQAPRSTRLLLQSALSLVSFQVRPSVPVASLNAAAGFPAANARRCQSSPRTFNFGRPTAPLLSMIPWLTTDRFPHGLLVMTPYSSSPFHPGSPFPSSNAYRYVNKIPPSTWKTKQ